MNIEHLTDQDPPASIQQHIITSITTSVVKPIERPSSETWPVTLGRESRDTSSRSNIGPSKFSQLYVGYACPSYIKKQYSSVSCTHTISTTAISSASTTAASTTKTSNSNLNLTRLPRHLLHLPRCLSSSSANTLSSGLRHL
jgi:hypothetical protein